MANSAKKNHVCVGQPKIFLQIVDSPSLPVVQQIWLVLREYLLVVYIQAMFFYSIKQGCLKIKKHWVRRVLNKYLRYQIFFLAWQSFIPSINDIIILFVCDRFESKLLHSIGNMIDWRSYVNKNGAGLDLQACSHSRRVGWSEVYILQRLRRLEVCTVIQGPLVQTATAQSEAGSWFRSESAVKNKL